MEFMWTFLGIFLVVTVNSRSTAQSHASVHPSINKHLLEDIKSLDTYIDNHTLEVISDPNNEVDHGTDHKQIHIKSKTDETDFRNIDKQVQTADRSHSAGNTNRENLKQQQSRFLKHSFDTVNVPPDQEDATSNTDENEDTDVHKTDTVKYDIEKSKLNENDQEKSSKKSEISHSLRHDLPSIHDKGSEKVRDKVQKDVKGGGEGEGIKDKGELKKKVKIKVLEAENGKPKTHDQEQQYNKLDQTQKKTKEEGERNKAELNEDKKIKSSHTSEHNIPKPYDKKQVPYKTEDLPKTYDHEQQYNKLDQTQKKTKEEGERNKEELKEDKKIKSSHTSEHNIPKPYDKKQVPYKTEDLPKTYDHEQQYNKLDQTQKKTKEEGERNKEELKEDKKIKSSHTSEHNIPKPYDKQQVPYKTKQIPKETKVGHERKEDQEKLKKEMNDINKETKNGAKDHSQTRHSGSYFKNKHTTMSYKITKPNDKHERVRVNTSIDNGMTNVHNRHDSIKSDKPVSHENNTIPMQTTDKKVLKETAFDAHIGNVSKPETSNKGNSANNTTKGNMNKVTKLRNATSQKPNVSKLTSQFLSSLKEGKTPLTTSERKDILTTSTIKEKLQSEHMHTSTSLNQETHKLQSTTDKTVTEAKAKPGKVYKTIRPHQQDATWHSTSQPRNTKNHAGNSLSFSSKNKDNIKEPKNAAGNRKVHGKDKPNETATHTKQTEIQRKVNKSDKTNGNNLAEQSFEDDQSSEDPCKGRTDPSRQYTGSALVAAAVGGVFIGAFAVLLLFHLKQKCKKYVNGDYRRVPMDYDFELNPRFKAH